TVSCVAFLIGRAFLAARGTGVNCVASAVWANEPHDGCCSGPTVERLALGVVRRVLPSQVGRVEERTIPTAMAVRQQRAAEAAPCDVPDDDFALGHESSLAMN